MPINNQLQKEALGLIAGNGKFPILFAKCAKQKQDLRIVAIAITGDTSKMLKPLVDELNWVRPGELGKMLEILKEKGIRKVAMAGQVNPKNLFDKRISLDNELKNILENIKDKKADTIFKAIASRLENQGLEIINSTTYVTEYLPKLGVLTKRCPTEREWEDIRFGKTIAKAVALLDIGQTVVVKEKAILAIEALEGTNATILRGARIAGFGAVVVKVSRPNQDMRFDIPVVGLKTIEILLKVKASCLAIEAEKTLFLDKEKSLELANKHNLCVIAT
ncbi:MAG: UDP-2,3-diacylglucosamine diphosphatase LpxI [Candidatus Omnitrophota bacterium]|nr:UDP-2,3-diacylglucosamine diphosphatase LpxI [Candidatus Omnitrophota bacterium]